MKRHILLPILVSFISSMGIFVQYKFSKQKPYKTEEHSVIKHKIPKKVEPARPLKIQKHHVTKPNGVSTRYHS